MGIYTFDNIKYRLGMTEVSSWMYMYLDFVVMNKVLMVTLPFSIALVFHISIALQSNQL